MDLIRKTSRVEDYPVTGGGASIEDGHDDASSWPGMGNRIISAGGAPVLIVPPIPCASLLLGSRVGIST
jgi:hypothetical protein